MVVGVVSTLALAYIPEGQWFPAAVVYGFALLFCTASTIFYDSLLVSVASPKDYDMISSLGYAFGYLAGGVLFALNVVMYLKPEIFGIETPVAAVLLSFVTVAVWWFLFSIPILLFVQEPTHELSEEKISLLLKHSVQQLGGTAVKIFKHKNLFYFLLAYWFYIDGVSTVMAMAVDFGASIHLESGSLIKALLLVQFVGFPSAYLAGHLAGKFSSRQVILASIFIYIIAVIGASQMSTELHFYVMACAIGLAQGSIQALSRSLFAKLIPKDNAGEYFGFFNLLGKFASVLGPILMAVSTIYFKQAQYAILSLLILFVIGFYFLQKVKSPIETA